MKYGKETLNYTNKYSVVMGKFISWLFCGEFGEREGPLLFQQNLWNREMNQVGLVDVPELQEKKNNPENLLSRQQINLP